MILARKKKKIVHHHVNHDRWMVSYADFVTLLFAVFVVLFASAQQDQGSPQQISEAVTRALRNGSIREAIRVMRAGSPVARVNKPELHSSLESLNERLADEIASGKVDVRMDGRGLIISLRQAAFFPSGLAVIDPQTYPIIDKLAVVLTGIPNAIRLEGHTDAIPIKNSRFASNWELSAARSIAMVELFVNRNRIDRSRLSIAGFAETAPMGSNDDAEGRARNRRVDVVILNAGGPAPVRPVAGT